MLLKGLLSLIKIKNNFLKKIYNLVDINNIDNVFYSSNLKKAYYQELIMRRNAAAASDILRLCILYKMGGVYVDVDTLPSLKFIYGDIPLHINANIANIVQSEYYLRKIDFEHWYKTNKKIYNLKDLGLPCPNIKVNRDLISLAAYVSIDEYNYIIRNNYDKGVGRIEKDHYLARLAYYRYDTINKRSNVTLFLSGPILILEVIIGCSYKILDLPDNISPFAISCLLRMAGTGVSIIEHTNYTPGHVRSSWM
ncbi:TcdA/TcdB catalytic glycosyltransferase domain-containing protein [Pasteurella testudinis DSM 23072]|uniref:TcdA/TcdB catalytic glycosyltransferase domain-containing protein n=2 Tax=Pasteurella testudinis TaxID=761 RepID=A0A1W1UZV4_9PAST|nr:TcdA/TcdB catalytic glycosyltransferase domain-containing protein [Pasteurella testudinis DSM 23072]SUB51832.1 Toxin B [Pasteurella testudinis]